MVGAISMCFCKTTRWTNTGRGIWNANTLQGALYFYILQPPQQDNKRSLPKEFWTRLMVMDFCNNKQTKKKSDICPTAPGKEKLQWHILHELSTSELLSKKYLCQTTHCPQCLNTMTQHHTQKTAFTWSFALLHRKNILISKAYTCSDIQRFIWAWNTHFWYYLTVTNSSQRHFWFLFSFFYNVPQQLTCIHIHWLLQQQGIKKGWGREFLKYYVKRQGEQNL